MADTKLLDYWIHLLEGLLPLVVLVLGVFILVVALFLLALHVLDFIRLSRKPSVLLELTPPAGSDNTPQATSQMFAVLHGLNASRTITDKLLRRKVRFALEIVSTRELGIRYLIRASEDDATTFEHSIRSYLPDAKLKRVDDYLPGAPHSRPARIVEANQTGHFAYPLRTQFSLSQYDPIAYLTGAMTKLEPDEIMAFQIVVTPAKVRSAQTLAQGVFKNAEMIDRLGDRRSSVTTSVFSGINSVLFSLTDGVGEVFHGSGYTHRGNEAITSHRQQVATGIKPPRVLSAIEQELATAVHEKLSQPLFRASIRAFVLVNTTEKEKQRVRSLRDWLSALGDPRFQALRARIELPFRMLQPFRRFMYSRRMPALNPKNGGIFSATEIGELYHIAHSKTAKTENVARSLSKTLPAQISLKNNPTFDIVLGQNVHHGATTEIGLTMAERERHVYIIGGTGNGKTTMMMYGMVQDLKNGKGFAFVDPHGDAAEEILRHVPGSRVQDVIYFNPDDLSYPIGLNLLEIPEGVTGDDLLREKDRVTEATISVFRKIFSDDGTGGHRIEYVLRNTIQTALTVEGATLFTIFRLLNDEEYRKGIVDNLLDEDLKNFWENELGKAGDFQRVKMSAGITAKIGRFLFSASAKRILEQPRSTIDFDDILDSGKVLICNFSKGILGEDTSELFGITVLAKLQMAALRRARIGAMNRRPYFLYVDEFQNFATTSFVQMLSEARKYKLFLTMAEQSTSQQDDQQMVNIILANVGTVVCFRTGNPADEQYLLPLFSPYIQAGEIASLPTYNFYARLSAVTSQEPTSGETIVIGDTGSEEIADRVKGVSRAEYAIKYVESKTVEAVVPNKTIHKPKTLPKTDSRRERKVNARATDIRSKKSRP